MKAKLLFYGLLIGSAMFFCSCSTQQEPEPFSSFAGHEFNDLLSSLDKGNGDTLILGTENGKLIFHNTTNAASQMANVGGDKVYFAYPETLPDSTKVTFVGIRNEGLKMYWQSDYTFSNPKIFSYGEKKENYSVYKVIRYKNKLFCSTSNGLAELNLENIGDSLKIIYPKLPQENTVPKDYKIEAMVAAGDKLYLAHKDTLIQYNPQDGTDSIAKKNGKIKNLHWINQELMIVCEDTIFYDNNRGKYESPQKVHSCFFTSQNHGGDNEFFYSYQYLLMADNCFLIGNGLSEKSLSLHRLTLDKEQYSPTAQIIQNEGFIYFISGSTLCKLPLHPTKGKHVTALTRSDQTLYAINNTNTIYKQEKGEWKHMSNINGDKVHNVSTAIWAGESLCMLADNEIYFLVDSRIKVSLKDIYPSFKNDKIKKIYYNPSNQKLFFSWRSGYGYCTMKDGLPADTAHLRNSDGIISVQCFAQPKNDDNTLYIGTLNDGCIIKDLKKDSIKDQRFPKLTNIIDLMLTDTSLFVLTPVYLYRAHKDSVFFRDSVDIRDLHICRIHPLSQQKNKLLGVSQMGGLYIFSQDSMNNMPQTLYPDIIFYPDAIDVQGNKIVAGTNIGLVEINLENGNLTSIPLTYWYVWLKEWIIRNLRGFIKFGIPAAISLTIFIVFLLLLSVDRRKKIKKRNTEIEALKIENDKLNKQKRTLERENKNLNKKNGTLKVYNKNLTQQKQELEKSNTQLNLTNNELKTDNEHLSQKKQELEKDNSTLLTHNGELMTQNEFLSMQNTQLDKKNRQLNTTREKLESKNDLLKQEKENLNKKILELKKEFAASHEQVKKDVLFNNRQMLREKWDIGSDPQPKMLSHYQIYVDYMSKKKEITDEINHLEFDEDNQFHNNLEKLTQSIHTELFTPLLKMDACALREWAIDHEEELVNQSDEKYLKVFREEMDKLISNHLTKCITFHTGNREKETHDIYFSLFAASLLRVCPEMADEEKNLSRKMKKEINQRQKKIEDLTKSGCLYHLLYENMGIISIKNFERKKSNMKTEFEKIVKAKTTPLAYKLEFEIHNEFLMEALNKWFKSKDK
ncbi:MAG: hypothetical protein J5642_04365 [Bacteroidales bacterium]|nr:hypothetical protein [Bacteroidales bacterium]